jgi:hypothetical protein
MLCSNAILFVGSNIDLYLGSLLKPLVETDVFVKRFKNPVRRTKNVRDDDEVDCINDDFLLVSLGRLLEYWRSPRVGPTKYPVDDLLVSLGRLLEYWRSPRVGPTKYPVSFKDVVDVYDWKIYC